jgi:hypothetical protein
MKAFKFILPSLVSGILPLMAEESSVPPPVEQEVVPAVMPWVGLDVGKLDSAMRAHAIDIPQGVGFLVTSVAEGSPAEKAGVKGYDILWKFNDQMLINEAQFGTLLQMHKIGDSVKLTIVRSGQHETLDLVLAPTPIPAVATELSPVDIPLVPAGVPGLPRSIVYPKERKAVVSRDDGGMAELRYEEGEAMVMIKDSEGEVLYEGPVRKDGKMVVPSEWRCSVGALMRTMHHAEDGDWKVRRPRPRVVTPPVVRDR